MFFQKFFENLFHQVVILWSRNNFNQNFFVFLFLNLRKVFSFQKKTKQLNQVSPNQIIDFKDLTFVRFELVVLGEFFHFFDWLQVNDKGFDEAENILFWNFFWWLLFFLSSSFLVLWTTGHEVDFLLVLLIKAIELC